MKKVIYFSSLFLCLISVHSCQRDDICPDSTQTTPKLVIEFRDFENPDKLKNVRNLNVRIENDTTYFFEGPQNNSEIAIPLDTSKDLTNYEFVQNSKSDLEGVVANVDKIRFSYATKEVFVNRACGYRTEFLEFNASLVGEKDNGNWINNVEVQQPNDIIDESTTHLYIYH